jgi:hypothetical protein
LRRIYAQSLRKVIQRITENSQQNRDNTGRDETA